MLEVLESSFMWPTWPATVLVIVCCVYWLMVIVGAVTVDALHIDFHDVHFDTDVDGSLLDLGFVPLRFLNLGRVPLMLWVSVFALAAWTVSRLIAANYGQPAPHAEFIFSSDSLAILRDFAIGAVIAKLVTQPLCGKFDVIEPIGSKDLLGNTCVITSHEVTEKRGEATYATGGAPLTLHVKAIEKGLNKGDTATIVDYSPDDNVYFVKRAEHEV
jgi:hypothetical protein